MRLLLLAALLSAFWAAAWTLVDEAVGAPLQPVPRAQLHGPESGAWPPRPVAHPLKSYSLVARAGRLTG